FSRQKPDVISVSKLSETIMKKIMDDIGIKTAKLSVEDFLPLEPVSCEPFRWDIEQEEVQQMQDVEKWFKNVLSLPRNFHVKDVHKQVNFQRHLRGANTIITGGADISVGPSETACVWIEIKKTFEDFKEGQAMGELFLIDKLHPTNAMTVLTDCNDNWIIYFFLKINEEQYMATSRIDDRGTAMAIIKQFVLEEGQNFHNWIGKDITYQVDLPAPLKKKTKFLESITETVDARMADMVGDMSEQELFNMTARKRLMLVRDYCRLDEQPQLDQLIRQFSDNYENQPPMMVHNYAGPPHMAEFDSWTGCKLYHIAMLCL
ncbi:3062_t:CDS:2, partial [Funneliformis mosseae]